MWIYFYALCSDPLKCMSVFVPVLCCLIPVALYYSLKSGKVMPPALFFFLRIASAVLGLLWFHINFRIICSSSVKNVMGILIGVVLLNL